ncbi:MAG: pilus assembly protein TadG-related protein, partial [Hyphomicrobium sp.]|nr:pilus assembly protein TadG-related protein [Hyphomicrobium sp.]
TIKTIRSTTQAMARDETGSIAIIFGICAFFVVMVTGLAIDIGRVMHAERTLTSAIDAAALAAAKGMKTSTLNDAEVETLAQRYFNANMAGHGGSYAIVQSFSVNVDRPRNSVAIEVRSEVPMLFANVGGIDKISIPKGSVAIYDTKDIEVGLQLDVTGSMSGSKLRDLKTAVGDLIDILLPDEGTTNRVRIALAPYAAGVNAGSLAAAISEGTAGRDGCVYERREASEQATDTVPVGTAALKVRAQLPGATACPSDAIIRPMTDDKALLKEAIRSYSASGTTAGHLGTAWAWYTLSPNWKTLWPAANQPAAYGAEDLSKVAILMTDGEYNTQYDANGIAVDQNKTNCPNAANGCATNQARSLCTAMKAAGITVYTIGFDIGGTNTTAYQTLSQCASDPTMAYNAEDGDQLKQAYYDIGLKLAKLYLSK